MSHVTRFKSCQVWHELSLPFFILELCLVFSVSVEDCKFMDSKMRPLFLVFKNSDDLGDLVRVIFKNGDGECGISLDRLIVKLLKKCTCNLVHSHACHPTPPLRDDPGERDLCVFRIIGTLYFAAQIM